MTIDKADKNSPKFLKLIIVTNAPNEKALAGVMLSTTEKNLGCAPVSDAGLRQLRMEIQMSNVPSTSNMAGTKILCSPSLDPAAS